MKFAEFTYLEKTNFTVTTHTSNLPLYGMASKNLTYQDVRLWGKTQSIIRFKLINCSMLWYSGKLTIIQIDGLPSKYISLIMTGYNLTDWSSIVVMCHH